MGIAGASAASARWNQPWATYALALSSRARFVLANRNGIATIASMLCPSQPIQPGAEDKLAALRRLDQSRAWNTLDDQLYCTSCKSVISGRQIAVVGGTNGLRALHLKSLRPVAFPLRLTGSCPLNRRLSVKWTFFFAITVFEPLTCP